MSLDQAYALFNERRKANPLDRGLAAGLQAYENPEIPRRSGIGPIDQAALKSSVQQAIDRTTQQQQLLQDISAKQALGLPTPTGTSGAAYNYLMGRGQYPVNPILAGQPGSALTSPTVSMPYEAATKVGSPTQSETSQAAANAPSKMPAMNYGPANMPKPNMLNQALGTLGPMYLGYKYLMPEAMKSSIASGISSLGSALGIGSAAYTPGAAYAGPAGAISEGLEIGGGFNPATASAATEAGAAETAGFTIDPITGALVLAAATPVGQNIIKGAGDIVGGAVKGAGDFVSNIFGGFGFKDGGETKDGLSAAYKSTLGDYSDGGRLLKGPGDGVSDSIPATIGGKQPARLADGEFVVPARIVSELGNGSTSAGAKKLYAMMDRIQTGRKKSIGKGKVAVNSRADKYLPA